MELRSRKNKSKENLSLKKVEKDSNEQIKLLLNQIKNNNKDTNSDITLSIVQAMVDKNFISLSQNEIIKCLSSSFPKNSNLRREVISSLKNNIFTQLKKNSKYELNFEECAFYLKTYKDKDDSSNSNNSNEKASLNQPIISPVINFPETENKTIYFTPEDNQQNTNMTMDEENFDSSFTFGEQSLIKASGNKNNSYIKDENELKNISNDTEELENKALEKYIPEFDLVFDENKYFKTLTEESTQFLDVYKSSNNNEINVNKLSEDIKKLNQLIEKLNIKTNPFNKLSSLFNEEKGELFNSKSVIQQQLNLMQILVDNDFLPADLYTSEKEILLIYQEDFKKLFNKLQDHYIDIKNMEQDINKLITSLKNFLNEIADYFVLKLSDKYSDYYNLILNINKSKSIKINVNINETVKLFLFYISENERLFAKIDELAKSKNPEI